MSPIYFSRQSIRARLIVGYLAVYAVVMTVGGLFLYVTLEHAITHNIKSELQNTTDAMRNMVQVAANVSIRNRLRGIAEKNAQIVAALYDRRQRGELDEATAKTRAREILTSQTIGKTGYIYVLDSHGIIREHPQAAMVGTDLSGQGFIQEQMRRKSGYLEYDASRPGDPHANSKALYMSYFAPWDWIISVSAVRSELRQLVDVRDFRQQVLTPRFGETGFSFVIDSSGGLVIHPSREGENLMDANDAEGRELVREMRRIKDGSIVYGATGPNTSAPRKKLALFHYLPELDWIVVSAGYLDEFYRPLRWLAYAILSTAGVMLALVLVLSAWISAGIARPVHALIAGFTKGASGDLDARVVPAGAAEISQLGRYFNEFMTNFEEYHRRLESSERQYRAIIEGAVEGIFQATPEGRVIKANPSFAHLLGYDDPAQLLAAASDSQALYVDSADLRRLISQLRTQGTVTGFEVNLLRRDGHSIWCQLNARAVRGQAGELDYVEGFLTDITARKAVEGALQRSKEELEQRVATRTAELVAKATELEQRNQEATLLHELADLLATCQSLREAQPIIARYAPRLFPGTSGTYFTAEGESGLLIGSANWGDEPASRADALAAEHCWALRNQKVYAAGGDDPHPHCPHVAAVAADRPSLCIPLMAQRSVVGLLHVLGAVHQPRSVTQSMRLLAESASGHLSLGIGNVQLRETLHHQTITDGLTGLCNRRYLDTTLARELHRAKRARTPLGLIMADLDHFKAVNDDYGHETGDMVLKQFGQLLTRNIRQEDFACRYGGEEITIVLPNADLEVALRRAERLRAEAEAKLRAADRPVTVSLGVAVFPRHGEDAAALLAAADAALYRAKHDGRNRVQSAEPE